MLFVSWLQHGSVIILTLNKIVVVYSAIEKCVTRLVLMLEQLLIPEVLSVFLKLACKRIFTQARIIISILVCL